MVRSLCLILLLAAVCAAQAPDRGAAVASSPNSGRRIALVIGNRAYPSHPLENSVNDAQDLGAVLKSQLNFQTTVKTDLKQEGFERSVEDFVGQVQPGDTALFYYAGHGMQIDGENLLLPTDFSATDDIAAKYRAYHVNQLRDRLRGRGARITIIVLDACRDNPFRTWRSASGGGLAGMGGEGAYIAFAADEGKTAQDNPGERNGLFTKHLLTELREPGLTISEVFDRVRENVYRESNGRQTPFAYSGLIGTFRFREIAAASATAIDLDIERYNAVKDSRDAAQLETVAGEISRADLAGILRERARSLRSLAATSPAVAAPLARNMTELCEGFSGTWNQGPDLTNLVVTQNGCEIHGEFNNGGETVVFRHTLTGHATGSGVSIMIERIDQRNGCRTVMNGRLVLINARQLTSELSGTDGRCDVPATWREQRNWVKVR